MGLGTVVIHRTAFVAASCGGRCSLLSLLLKSPVDPISIVSFIFLLIHEKFCVDTQDSQFFLFFLLTCQDHSCDLSCSGTVVFIAG